MDSEGIRLPPKPFYQYPTALFKSTQLDLTPEKKSTKSTTKRPIIQQNRFKIPTDISENPPDETKKTFACLAQPSMNSTNQMSRKLAVLQRETFDAAAAIAEELEQSEIVRTNLGEKVAQAVNVKKGSRIYSDLVPLDVDDKHVLAECAHAKARSAFKTIKSQSQEPDIMAFFSEEFETQAAHFDCEEFYREEPLPKPTPASPTHVFDLYRHLQCWQE